MEKVSFHAGKGEQMSFIAKIKRGFRNFFVRQLNSVWKRVFGRRFASIHVVYPESALAHRYCIGKGLEIGGSAHNPFGLNTLNVDFSDSTDRSFKQFEIQQCSHTLSVDIVASGDDIPLPDESQDFIVSSHVIEHFPDTIKGLIEWDRLVKPGGIIFIIVPHKDRTFEKDRECTPLSEIVQAFKDKRSQSHAPGVPHPHYFCWVTETFVELIEFMIEHMAMEWEIAEVQDVDDKAGNGFTVVIRKLKTRNPGKCLSGHFKGIQ